MTQWYYADRQRQQQGPLTGPELAALFRAGQVDATTLVWHEGLAGWQPLSASRDELELDAPPPTLDFRTAPEPPAAPEPVVALAPGAAGYSPYAAPAAAMAMAQAGPVLGGEVVMAGFWKRVAASIIDGFAIGIPVAVIVMIVGGLLGWGSSFSGTLLGRSQFNPAETVMSWVLSALVFAWFHSSAGLLATPGKLAIGIKVVRTDGGRISFLRGFARYWAYMLSSLLLCIGLLMAAFTGRKQGLHDFMCDTLVVDKWAFTSHPERQRDELGTVAMVVLVLGGLLIVGLLVLGVAAGFAVASMGR